MHLQKWQYNREWQQSEAEKKEYAALNKGKRLTSMYETLRNLEGECCRDWMHEAPKHAHRTLIYYNKLRLSQYL